MRGDLMNNDDQKPTFKKPEENPPKPPDDQAKYFAYWEAKRIQRLREEHENTEGLSIYQRSRRG
jgi:hypothetical protein